MTKCAEREITGYLAAHSIPNIFYVLRKGYSQEERRKFIKNLCEIFRISDLEVSPKINNMKEGMGAGSWDLGDKLIGKKDSYTIKRR